jgi:hypothetical protein
MNGARTSRRAEYQASRPLTQEDQAVLEAAKAASGRRRFLRGHCFCNAQRLALADEGVSYVEGVAWSGRMAFHHGWNLINGKVVDVTLKGRSAPGEYLAGKTLSRSEVAAHWISLGTGRAIDMTVLDYDDVDELIRTMDAAHS